MLEPHRHSTAALIAEQTGSHPGRAEGRAGDARQPRDDLARGGRAPPDRQKKRCARPNTIDLTLRWRARLARRAAPGGIPRTSCSSTKRASPAISSRRTAARCAAPACMTTPRVAGGRRVRSSPRSASPASPRRGVFAGAIDGGVPRLRRAAVGPHAAARRPRHRRQSQRPQVAGVRLAIERVGATLVYLPPCSPDLNPIALCFAKLKAIVRAARCRSIETLWPLLGECVPRFSADECRNYFRHCGYTGATRL